VSILAPDSRPQVWTVERIRLVGAGQLLSEADDSLQGRAEGVPGSVSLAHEGARAAT
jgi:hypothetical protein